MTSPVELSDLLAEVLPEINRENPDAAYRAKLVTVRQLQLKGMSDTVIEKALGISIRPADRVTVEVGDRAGLLLQIRWDRPVRRDTDAQSVMGSLEILIRGETVHARDQVPATSWKFNAQPLLELLSTQWPYLVLEIDATGDQPGKNYFSGVNLTQALKAHVNGRRLPIHVSRIGTLMSFRVANQEWRVDFNAAIGVFEKFGQLLHERLAGTEKTWLRRMEIEPKKALELAVGKSRPTLLTRIEHRLRSLGQKFDLASLTNSTPELVVAARMAPAYLSDNEISQLLKWVSEIPLSASSPALSEASAAGRKWLDDHFDPAWKEFNEGYELAGWFRRYCQKKADTDPIDVEKILGEWSVGVAVREFAPSLDAIAVWGKFHGPSIILNANGLHSHSSGGRRATLAHEICHMLLDRRSALPIAEILGGRIPKGIESRARAFAAELLLPRSAANRVVRESFNVRAAVERLSDQYQVSAALAAWQITNSKPHLTAAERNWLKDVAYGPANSAKSTDGIEPVP
jgi:Zn-dependent peptidase ImmA (M78 family)